MDLHFMSKKASFRGNFRSYSYLDMTIVQIKGVQMFRFTPSTLRGVFNAKS